MPYGKQIADVERSIEKLQTAIAELRRSKRGSPQIDQHLASLAKLRAERIRLMMHQPPPSAPPQRRISN